MFESGEWLRILEQVDAEVALTEGFTTLVALAIDREMVSGASSGDSKAYFLGPSRPEIAEWTQHQRKNPPLGSESADVVPFMSTAVSGGRVLIMSDGVWRYCGFEALEGALRQPLEEVPAYLKAAILRRSGSTLPDDFSIIGIDVDG